jgi:calcineurin-like phosphoesterase family protein
MARYILSDLHLGHENIIDYCDRPFDSVQEMDKILIDNWNRTVDANDIVFFLGDLGHFANEAQLRDWLDKLNGRIVFIEGNHDHPDEYVDSLNTHQYYILSQGGLELCCTHRPANAPSFWDGWIIHGHHHNNHMDDYPLVNPEKKSMNVSAELLNYEPLTVTDLVTYVEQGKRIASR